VLATRAEQVADRSQPGDAMPADAERDAARKLLERRASTFRRETDPRRRRQKAYALLARNGFTPDVCNEVASTLTDDGSEQAV